MRALASVLVAALKMRDALRHQRHRLRASGLKAVCIEFQQRAKFVGMRRGQFYSVDGKRENRLSET